MTQVWEQPAFSEWTSTNTTTWDTSRYNTVSCDGSHTVEQQGIHALAGSNSGWHSTTNSLPHWVGFYTKLIIVKSFSFRVDGNTGYVPTTFYWQGSNDGSTWETLGSFSRNQNMVEDETYVIPENKRSAYKFHRLYITAAPNSYQYVCNLRINAELETISERLQSYIGWSQPVVTSNTSYGIISASSSAENCEAFRAVDTVTSTESNGWATDNSQEGWWKWEFPESLKFKRIVFVNRNSETNDPEVLFQQCQFYAGNRTSRMGSPFSVSKSREYVTVDCDNLESNILYFYKLGGKYSGIGELIIEATSCKPTAHVVTTKSIKNVYAYGKPLCQLYNAGSLIWKNPSIITYDDFVYPKMTDNFSYGILNASDSAADSYLAFDSDNINSYMASTPGPQWILWTLPHDILVKEITFKNAYSLEGERSKTVQFFADESMSVPLTEEFIAKNSDGGETVIEVPAIKTNKIYCYIKDGYGENNIVGVGEIKILGRTKKHEQPLEYFSKADFPELHANTSNELIPWVQPVLFSNNSYGKVSASSTSSYGNQPYTALDGIPNSRGWATDNSSIGWWKWELPETITIKGLVYVGQGTGENKESDTVCQGRFYADEAKTIPIGDPIDQSLVQDFVRIEVENIPEEGIETNCIYFDKTGGGPYSGMAELYVSAVCRGSIVSVSTNNTALEESEFYKLFDGNSSEIGWVSNEVSSWESHIEEDYAPWTCPIFSSNTTWGTVSASSEGYPAYYALNGTFGNSSDYSNTWESAGETSAWWKWKFASSLRVSKIRVYNRAYSASYYTDTVTIRTFDKSEVLLDTSLVPRQENSYVELVFDVPRDLDGIYIDVTGTSYVGIGEIEIEAQSGVSLEVHPPTADLFFEKDPMLVNGVTITNGDSAVTSFEWQVSNDGRSYKTFGIIPTPEFSHYANSQCNVPIPHDEKSYKYHRCIIRGLADSANVVSMKELSLNTYARDFVEVDFSYPFTNTSGLTISNINGWFPDGSSQAFVNNDIVDGGSTSMQISIEISDDVELFYKIGVSSESNYDFARFYLNSVELHSMSGTNDAESSVKLSPGTHIIECEYSKDGSVTAGSDCMYLYYLKTRKS